MKNIKLNTILNELQVGTVANTLLDNSQIVIIGEKTRGFIQVSSEGFDYNVYQIDAPWDDNTEMYDESYMLDGGLCELGDAVDGINNLVEMMKYEESKLKEKGIEFNGVFTISGHEVKVSKFRDEVLPAENIDQINYAILEGSKSGTIRIYKDYQTSDSKIKSTSYTTNEWEIIEDELLLYEDIDIHKLMTMNNSSMVSISVEKLIELTSLKELIECDNISHTYTIINVKRDIYAYVISDLKDTGAWFAETDNEDNYTQIDIDNENVLLVLRKHNLLSEDEVLKIKALPIKTIELVS